MKVLQIGEGNFLRAFAEEFIQRLGGEVIICQPRTNTKVINALKVQDCRYDIIKRGLLNGAVIDERIPVSCVRACIDTATEFDTLKALMHDADVNVIISNTTEAGITFCDSDTIDAVPAGTFPAKLTALLYERFLSGAGEIVLLPVELIENNADCLKECVLQYADLWNLGAEFKAFLDSDCSFCNTLVDRIVSGHDASDSDPCSVNCEPYASWVIQADERCKRIFPAADAQMGAVYATDITPYRTRKVRILNGTHTMSVLAAYQCGFDIVRDMMHDELFSAYIDKGLAEIKSTIDLPKEELDTFAESVTERFMNPYIDHKLLDISLNSVAKFQARCMDTILDYQKKNGAVPPILSFSLAALFAFYMHQGSNREYPVNDSDAVLTFFENAKALTPDELVKSALKTLYNMENEALCDAVIKGYTAICDKGIAVAVNEAVYG